MASAGLIAQVGPCKLCLTSLTRGSLLKGPSLPVKHFSVSVVHGREKKASNMGPNGLIYKEERAAKILKEHNGRFIWPLPDYQKARQIRKDAVGRFQMQKLKRDGLMPPKDFAERPIDISSSSQINEPYVPHEGDGSKSFLSSFKEASIEKKDRAAMWTKTKRAVRKLSKIEKDSGGFSADYFSEEAVDIYAMAHQAMAAGDITRLHELVTSRCYKTMAHGMQYKTLRWRFHANVEPPRLVHASIFAQGPLGNEFAQATIRIHSEQTVAIYDRFGRLAYGDPELKRTVLEFVVFEKRVSDTYGTWRMHGKIEPDFCEAKPPVHKTFRVPEHEEISEADIEKMAAKDVVGEGEEDETEEGETEEDDKKKALA